MLSTFFLLNCRCFARNMINIIMKKLIFTVLLLLSVSLFSQTPGGVGDSNINLWYRGDNTTITNSEPGEFRWPSENGGATENYAFQSTTGAKPAQNNLFNFNETYTFDGTSDFLAIKNLNYTVGTEIANLYGFVVYSSTFSSNSTIDNHAFVGFSRNHGFSMALTGEGKLSFRFRDPDTNSNDELEGSSTSNPNDGSPHIATYMFEALNVTADTQIRFDGNVDAAENLLDGNITMRSTRFGYIGDGSNSNNENDGGNFDNFFEGDIAEIILYNQSDPLGATDILKIETYLALKYGITLDNSAGTSAGDYIDSAGNIIWDASDNVEFHNGVGGIINDSTVGSIHQKIANPHDSFLTVTTGITGGTVHDFTSENNDVSRTDVTSDTYLMFGDNGVVGGFETCGVAGKLLLKKKWLFKESAIETNNVFLSVSEELFPDGASVQMIISADDIYDGSDTTVSLTNLGGVYFTPTNIDIDDDARVSFLIDDVKIAGVSLSKIDLHIKADESSIVDGKLTLRDASLNLADAVENLATNRPGTSDLMNFNPTLTFDGDNDYLFIRNKHYDLGDEIPNLHVFTVFCTGFSDGGTLTNSSFLDFDRIGPFSSYIRGDGMLGLKYRSGGSNRTETGTAILNDDLPHISEAVFDGDIVGDDTFVKYDGVLDDSDEKLPGNIIVDKTRYGIIGDESDDDQENGSTRGVNYEGQISEIILADRVAFTENETIQLESYLALKYGITLDISVENYLNSSGTVIWDDTDPTYWNGIAGIIKDDTDSDLDQRIAQSSSSKDIIVSTLHSTTPLIPLLTESNLDTNRTMLNEGSYLLFGNNGGIGGAFEDNLDLSTSVTTRHWFFKEDGTNLDDNVIVAIPKSYFPEGSTGITAYISADDVFTSADTDIPVSEIEIDGITYCYISQDIDDGQYLAYSFSLPVLIGPGNVTDGLKMWIKTDENVSSSGGILNSITDASLNGNNVVQTDNTFKPTISNNEINFNPTISFDTQRLAIENLNYNTAGAIDKMYAWVIYQTDHANPNTNVGVDDRNASFISFDRREYFNIHVRGDGKLSLLYRDFDDEIKFSIGSTVTNTGLTQLGGFIFDTSLVDGDETILRLNGLEDFKDDLTTFNIGTNTGTETRFGYIGDGSQATEFAGSTRNRYYEGSISEIIFYEGETLDADQIRRVESYLAIKYGVTIDGDYIDSTMPVANVIWDATTDSDYNNDIAVIGRDDNSHLYQKQSRSESSDGILTISIDTSIAESNEDNSGTFDDDLDFLAWGNNSTDQGFFTDCSTSTLKVNKTWMVQNTGSVGDVTMEFDMSNIPDPGSYELIIDIDGDFSTTGDQTTESGSLLDTNLTFSTVTLDDGVFFSLFKSSPSDIVYNGSWSGGSGPGSAPDETDIGKRITIESSVTLAESFNCNCLEVEAGNIVTVPTGMYIDANEIILDGDIYLEGTAELVQTDENANNSGSGQLYKIINEATSSLYRYNFFSSPVHTGGTFTLAGNFKFNTGGDLGSNTDPSFTGSDSDGFGTTISDRWLFSINNDTGFSSITENTPLDPGVGYTMKGTGVVNNYNFIGTPNNGEITVSIDEDNFMLTGNPYPSTINIDIFNANMLADGVTDGALYLWDHPQGDEHAIGSDNIGGYGTRINGVGTVAVTLNNDVIAGVTQPSQFIKPGQGFVVGGVLDGASLKFTNSLRNGIDYLTEASSAHFFRTIQNSSVASRSIIHLGFEYKNEKNKIFHRQIATVLEDFNLLEREVGKDAYMFDYFDNDAYWVLPNDDNRFVITGVPSLIDDEDMELPIGVSLSETRKITFKLDDIKGIDTNVYLKDNALGVSTNIINNNYETTVAAGDNLDRFSLVFKENEEEITLDLEKDIEEINQDLILVYSDNSGINIIQEKGNIVNVKIYDFTGKILVDYKNVSESKSLVFDTENMNTQLIIVKVITIDEIITKRILLKN